MYPKKHKKSWKNIIFFLIFFLLWVLFWIFSLTITNKQWNIYSFWIGNAIELSTVGWWTNNLPKLFLYLEFLSDFQKLALELFTASWRTNDLPKLFLCLEFFLPEFQKLAIELFPTSWRTNNLPKLFFCLPFLSDFQKTCYRTVNSQLMNK